MSVDWSVAGFSAIVGVLLVLVLLPVIERGFRIVTVHGHGESDGLTWIAMEYVEGAATLRDSLVRLAALDELPAGYDRTVAKLLIQLAEAMSAPSWLSTEKVRSFRIVAFKHINDCIGYASYVINGCAILHQRCCIPDGLKFPVSVPHHLW